MPINLFIDTNILLAFYHYTKEDLNELDKLSAAIDNHQIALLLPDQVVWEFRRNRERKIADAVKRLREQRLNLQFPQLCKGYPQHEQLIELQRKYEIIHEELLGRIAADARDSKLRADATIELLLSKATNIVVGPTLIEAAKTRSLRGNPPGKDESIGDAVIWEALLAHAPAGEDLHFVTDDGDYGSPLDGQDFSPLLLAEWRQRKLSTLRPYSRLSVFFKEHTAQIRLRLEAEKMALIAQLASSGSFSETHALIGKLNSFREFSNEQVAAIVGAAMANNQVSWILSDADVSGLLRRVIDGRGDALPPAVLTEVLGRLADAVPPDDALDP